MTKQMQLNAYLKTKCPTLTTDLSGYVISPFHLQLPESVLTQAKKSVEAFFRLRNNPTYQAYVNEQRPNLEVKKNYAVLMSYDFHLTENGLKMIEINTNASSSLLFAYLYEMENLKELGTSPFLNQIHQSFKEELQLCSMNTEGVNAWIMDEDPAHQKMYVEFQLYQQLMKSWGWHAEIVDTKTWSTKKDVDLDQKKDAVQMIYNRSTDFYFDKSPFLKNLYHSGRVCFSPNPHEYSLLADKQRMIDMSLKTNHEKWGMSAEDSEILLQVLPESYDSSHTELEVLWEKRKNLFFKPKSSYGGKAAYRGSSISRKAFEAMPKGEFLAQEYITAPSIEAYCDKARLGVEADLQEYKFDLRFYAYQDQIQLAGARVFKGQLTNFREPHSGLATIDFQ
ncbi:MAG: hypothetical protein AB7F59_02380 [Bdellovibrionales bacterium]